MPLCSKFYFQYKFITYFCSFVFFLGLYPSCFPLIYSLYEYLSSYKVSILFLYSHRLFSVTFLHNVYTWPLPVCNQKPGGPGTQKMLYLNISSLYLRRRVPGNFGIYQCPILEKKKEFKRKKMKGFQNVYFFFITIKIKTYCFTHGPLDHWHLECMTVVFNWSLIWKHPRSGLGIAGP